jgi:broad specificity phosphatase PhoE
MLKNTSITSLKYNSEYFRWEVNVINDHNHIRDIPDEDYPYEFTFVRHGESEGNEKDLFQGHADFPLTIKGIKQAQLLAESLKNKEVKFDKIISSPLSRAKETANIISNRYGMKTETDPIWMEINNGELAGLHFNEIDQKYPDRPDHKNPYLPTGEIGESWWGFYQRAGKALNMLISQPPGKYLVVSHGGFLNCLIYNILRIPPSLHMNSPIFRFGNTGRAKFGYDPKDDTWYFHNFGMRCHLKKVKE